MSTHLTTVTRLTRKIDILESMIEDQSRQAYYETIRRSTINALLELSLRAKEIDAFIAQVLDILFTAEPQSIEKKGAIFLFDKKMDELVLRAHSNLSADHVNFIKRLPVNHFLSEQVLSKGTIFHSSEYNNSFIQHLPEIEPHGHYYVPIRTGSRNYGLIILFKASNTPANEKDTNFFTSIADICAGALERMHYSQQIQRYQQDLEKQVEEQTRKLSDEKERLAVTLRSIGDGVITTDLDGSIVLINKITEQLTGWSQQEAHGQPVQKVFNIMNEKTGAPCDSPINKVLRSGKIAGLARHTALIAKDGTRYSIEDSGAPIFDKESRIIGSVLVFRDVTVSRKTAKELLKVKKLESVGVLAGGIAHDFNNLLAAILGNIELVSMSIDSDNKAYPLLQEAKTASVRAKELTQQLLTFSKGGEPVKKATSINKVIFESANFVLRGSPVACQYNIPDDLWLVDIDSGQISQVIQNLVINAKHAMPEGGMIQVTCANIADIESDPSVTLPDKAYIKITVQDSGCGITEKHLEQIFDPYFTTKEEGSGLGLAISHSIINKHQGHISVRSRIDKGTCFTIYLPVSDKHPSPILSKKTPQQKTAKARILIMDDELLVQDIAKQMLHALGHKVWLASDGTEAVRLFADHHKNGQGFDIIIMDLTIPGGMGGKDTIQEILKIDPQAKAVVSSGYSNDPVMANFQQYGFKAALAKPFLLEELNKTLTDMLS